MPLDTTNWSTTTEVDETTALLIRARGLLERGWCRFAPAQDARGDGISPTDDRAVAWCAVGAIAAAAGSRQFKAARDRLHAAIGGENIANFNNRQESVEPVLTAFDRAIAAGEQR
jgi:hypothetical protein